MDLTKPRAAVYELPSQRLEVFYVKTVLAGQRLRKLISPSRSGESGISKAVDPLTCPVREWRTHLLR
jgi:hypothetical protein